MTEERVTKPCLKLALHGVCECTCFSGLSSKRPDQLEECLCYCYLRTPKNTCHLLYLFGILSETSATGTVCVQTSNFNDHSTFCVRARRRTRLSATREGVRLELPGTLIVTKELAVIPFNYTISDQYTTHIRRQNCED